MFLRIEYHINPMSSISISQEKKITISEFFFVGGGGGMLKEFIGLILVLLNLDMLSFANSEDPDQLAGSAQFVIQYVHLYQHLD